MKSGIRSVFGFLTIVGLFGTQGAFAGSFVWYDYNEPLGAKDLAWAMEPILSGKFNGQTMGLARFQITNEFYLAPGTLITDRSTNGNNGDVRFRFPATAGSNNLLLSIRIGVVSEGTVDFLNGVVFAGYPNVLVLRGTNYFGQAPGTPDNKPYALVKKTAKDCIGSPGSFSPIGLSSSSNGTCVAKTNISMLRIAAGPQSDDQHVVFQVFSSERSPAEKTNLSEPGASGANLTADVYLTTLNGTSSGISELNAVESLVRRELGSSVSIHR